MYFGDPARIPRLDVYFTKSTWFTRDLTGKEANKTAESPPGALHKSSEGTGEEERASKRQKMMRKGKQRDVGSMLGDFF